MDHHTVIGGESYYIVGHTANDIAEQTGIQNDVTAGNNLSSNLGTDTGLHIVAGDGQLVIGVD